MFNFVRNDKVEFDDGVLRVPLSFLYNLVLSTDSGLFKLYKEKHVDDYIEDMLLGDLVEHCELFDIKTSDIKRLEIVADME